MDSGDCVRLDIYALSRGDVHTHANLSLHRSDARCIMRREHKIEGLQHLPLASAVAVSGWLAIVHVNYRSMCHDITRRRCKVPRIRERHDSSNRYIAHVRLQMLHAESGTGKAPG